MKSFADFGIDVPPGRTGEYYTTCHQCSAARKNAKAKCMSVNTDKGVWLCHHCGFRGTLKSGVEGKGNPYEWVPKRYRKPDYRATEPTKDLLGWFAGRGISKAVVERNRITVGKVYMPQIEKETEVIQFPFYRDGEVVNIKSRDGKKNFRQESGAERIFYGMDDVTEDWCIIVEGEIDKLSCEEAGYVNTISVPDGAPSPKAKDYTSKFNFLENCEEFLSRMSRIVLAVDSDEAGKTLEEELARRLGRERCYRVQWSEGCKDANEVLLNHGACGLADCLKAARPYPVKGVFEVSDLSPQIDRLYEEGMKRGRLPGWPCLNDLYSVREGEWTLVTGIPGHGKSEVIDAVMVNLAFDYGWTFAIFSPENQPLERHFAKLAEKFIGKPFNKGARDRMTRQEKEDAKRWISDRFVFILPEEDELTVDAVLKLARTTVLRKGVKGIVIDPWNELDHQRKTGSETEYISQSLTKIRRFARECKVHVWLVAHPAKLMKDKATGKYPVPTPYDVSGSAHWRNKADNCLCVFREFTEGNKLVDVHVQKIRFKEIGKVGVATLEYDYMTGRYSDPEARTTRPHYTDEPDDLPPF